MPYDDMARLQIAMEDSIDEFMKWHENQSDDKGQEPKGKLGIPVGQVLVMYIIHQTGCRLVEACRMATNPIEKVFVKNPNQSHASYEKQTRLTTGNDFTTKTKIPYEFTLPTDTKLLGYLPWFQQNAKEYLKDEIGLYN